MSNEIEIDQDVYEQSVTQVDDAIVFFKLYHYLSNLNYIRPLVEDKYGCIVVPAKMLRSVAYGFGRQDSFFCIHLTGILFEFFEQLIPIEAMFVSDVDCQGVAVMLKPLKYADYALPPIKMFFPIIPNKTYARAKNNCRYLTFTQIEHSLIKAGTYEVTKVLDSYVKISEQGDFNRILEDQDTLMGIFN